MYTYDSADKYWHDNNSYKEIGELYTTKKTAVVGKLDSRYSNNKKKSILSPDSDRIIYNYYSNPNVKDCDTVKETNNTSEKQIYVGRFFLAIYDVNKGNFICENPKSFLKNLVKPISEGGLGKDNKKLSQEDFNALCLGMKYVNVYGEYAYITSSLSDGRNVMFRLNTNTYEVESYHASNFDNFIGNKTIISRPFSISSNIYYLCKDNNTVKCYYVDTYHDNIYESEVFSNGLSSMVSSSTPENGLVALSDEKRGYVYFFASKSTDYAKVYNISSGTFVGLTLDKQWPFTSSSKFTQYLLTNDSNNDIVNDSDKSYTLNRDYIVLLSNDNHLIKIRPDIPQFSFILLTLNNGRVNGFYRSVVEHVPESEDDANYRYHLNLICTKTNGSKVYKDIDESVVSNTTYDIGSFSESVISDMYSDMNIYKNVFNTSGSNIIIGDYLESGRRRPLIKDVDNEFTNYPKEKYLGNGRYKTPRKGLEPENGVNIVKNISFGDTILNRIRLTPESAAGENPIIQDKNAQIFMRETGKDDDGKYTTGSLLWKHLSKTGIPYNTHIQTVGRIIIDGKDIPIENVLITPPENEKDYGSTLLTIDKLFDITKTSDSFVKNGKALYPGILFKNNEGFINDAIISNVYNLDGSFAYNDNARGNLLSPGLCEIKASCVVNANDDQYLIVATNFGKIASLNIKTGGYTKYNGENVGENAPNIYLNIDESSFESLGNIVCIEQYLKRIFVFFANGSVFKADLSNRTFLELSTTNIKIENAGTLNINRLCKRNGDVVFSVSNNGSGDQYVQLFDLKQEKWLSYTTTSVSSGNIKIDSSNQSKSFITFINNDMYILYHESSSATLYKLNTISGYLETIKNISMSGITNPKLGLAYDNNKRLYVLTNNTFGYLNIEDHSYASLLSYTKNNSSESELSRLRYFNDGNEEYVSTLNTNSSGYLCEYRYNIINNSWNFISPSYSSKEEYLKRFQESTRYNNNFEYYVEGGIFKVKDIRSKKVSNLKPLYYKWPTGKHITAIGFANNGTNMVFTFDNGDIGSIVIPTGEYFDPDSFPTYVRHVSEEHTFANKSEFVSYAKSNVPTKTNYLFDHWSLEINGEPLVESDLPKSEQLILYAVFHDSIEVPTNSSIRNIYNRGMLDEGAIDIYNVGKDVVFASSTKSVRFSEEIGCFFRGRDDKFTKQYVESDKGFVKDDKPVSPLPLCNSGMCTVGKYIIYVNGYNKFTDLPSLTCHNGVVVYDTEYDEYGVLYSGLDNVHGTTRAKINPVCYYFDGYIYSFGGLERIDEHVNGENYTRFRRTNKIEQIDLISGTIKELNSTYGTFTSQQITNNNDPKFKINDDYRFYIKKDDVLLSNINYDDVKKYVQVFNFNFRTLATTVTNQQINESLIKIPLSLNNNDYVTVKRDEIKNKLISNIASNDKFINNDNAILCVDESGEMGAIRISDDKYFKCTEFLNVFGNRNLLKISNANLEKTINSVLMDDGRYFIECSPRHSSYDTDMISYSHVIVDPKDFEVNKEIKTVSENYVSVKSINENYYCLKIDNGKVRIDNYNDKVSTFIKSNELDIEYDSSMKINMVVCSDTIYVFIVKGNKLYKILSYSIDSCTLNDLVFENDKELIMNTYFDNYIFKYNKYYDSIFTLYKNDGKLGLLVIHNTNEETHNSKEAINVTNFEINDLINFETSINNDFDFTFDKNHVIVYFGQSVITFVLNNVADIDSYTNIKYDDNIYICSNARLHSENGKLVTYDISGNKLTKTTKIINERDYSKTYNSDRIDGSSTNKEAFVCNDSEFVYVASEDFKRVSKTNIFDGRGMDFYIHESVIGSHRIRDISAINEMLYLMREDGVLLKYNTTDASLIELNCLDYDTSYENVQMCSGNEYVYIIRENKLSRFSSIDNTVKSYDEFNYLGSPLNIRFIDELNELRFVSKTESGIYKFYSFNIKEEYVRLLHEMNVSNENEKVHFDDHGNIIIISNDYKNAYMIMIDGNTFEIHKTENKNKTNVEYIKDISVVNDMAYLVVGDKNSIDVSLTKSPIYFNYIRPNRSSILKDKLNNNRTFTFNKEIYSFSEEGFIQKFNFDNLNLSNYSTDSIFDQNHYFGIENVIGIKVFLNGVVYIVGYNIIAEGIVRIVSIGYNLKTKQIDNRSYKNINVTGLSTTSNNLVVSKQASWYSRYIVFNLSIRNGIYNKCITINVFNSNIESEFDIGINQPSGSCLCVFDGLLYSVGGEKISENETFENKSLHSNFGIINGSSTEFADSKDVFDKNSTIIKLGKSILISGNENTSSISLNGANVFTPTVFNTSKLNERTEIFNHDNSFVVPLYDDTVMVGSNNNIYKLPSTLSFGLTKNKHIIRIYSGSTKDIFVSSDMNGKVISRIEVEREYGVCVKNVLDIDDNRTLLIYSNTPNVGTMFIHDNGTITVKRYDGTIFGEAINTGTNIHTIQEIDLTVLFDSELNEYDFREVDYAN